MYYKHGIRLHGLSKRTASDIKQKSIYIILRIVIKVKINILLTSPPPVLVLLVPIAPKMLVGVPMLLGIKVPIIPLMMILR